MLVLGNDCLGYLDNHATLLARGFPPEKWYGYSRTYHTSCSTYDVEATVL